MKLIIIFVTLIVCASYCNAMQFNITKAVASLKIVWEDTPIEKRNEIGILTADLVKMATESLMKVVELKLFCTPWTSWMCVDLRPLILSYAESIEDNFTLVF